MQKKERYRANIDLDIENAENPTPTAPPLRKGGKGKEEAQEDLSKLSFIRRVSGLVLREVQRESAQYGILVSSVTIRKIGFEPGLAQELDGLAKDLATASSRSTLVKQRNETALREAEGQLQVAKVQGLAQAAGKVAEANALLENELEAQLRRARTAAEALSIETEARARAIRGE